MTKALEEFTLGIAEIRSDLKFLEQSFELRPRIFDILDTNQQSDAIKLARNFGQNKNIQPASFCGPMLVRLVASFERYSRKLMQEVVDAWAKRAKKFERLPKGLIERNLILTGRVLGNCDPPRDYLNLNSASLVDNLAQCRPGQDEFRLNSEVFMGLIKGVTLDTLDKGLEIAQIQNWLNAVGADRALQTRLEKRRVPDTTKAIEARLKKLSRWRNNWAHGGDEMVSLSIADTLDELEFLKDFCTALDAAVMKQIAAAKLPL